MGYDGWDKVEALETKIGHFGQLVDLLRDGWALTVEAKPHVPHHCVCTLHKTKGWNRGDAQAVIVHEDGLLEGIGRVIYHVHEFVKRGSEEDGG